MRRLLFVHAVQFGYHVDTLYYCRYLRQDHDITYVCWDYGNERVVEEGVSVIYVPRTGGKLARVTRLVRTALAAMRVTSFDLAFVVYFRFCGLLGVFGRTPVIVMDVRTGWIRPGLAKMFAYNAGIWLESFAFRHVTVITEDLRRKLHLPRGKCHLIPLGAEPWEMMPKTLTEMRLLYVGTFQNRHIYKTVQGFDMFLGRAAGTIRATYDIVGSGTPEEVRQMLSTIAAAKYSHAITYHGRIPHPKLPPRFEAATVGVAFVPMIPQQEAQPYTKVYEYLMAGMPVIATANPSNRLLIDASNGVLCQDSAESFAEGLSLLHRSLSSYDSSAIRRRSMTFSWKHIVRGNVHPYFQRLMERKDETSWR